ncbi:GspH/FimT family pseudopilin [Alteromonas ponticola]|uniref:Type II secretion system protein H n=1 Tax=Alteromonas ponticola TaxID=2720613 RepID=A0ABX1QXH7_9ALTE|nr:GspH/FimT family pseudopilin [Alteromonas ponticola]NMH58952.1 hypothetical protein [Alteromonas ponticola]
MEKQGYTLVQVMVVVSIISILLTAGMPSFTDFQQRQHLQQILLNAHRLFNEARQLAILNKNTVTVVVEASDNWCIGATKEAMCDCHQVASCSLNDRPMQVSGTHTGIKLADTRKQAIAKVMFAGGYGTAYGSATTLTFTSNIGVGKVVINNLGRVRLCADNSTSIGLPQC